jgi:hypothetical protein
MRCFSADAAAPTAGMMLMWVVLQKHRTHLDILATGRRKSATKMVVVNRWMPSHALLGWREPTQNHPDHRDAGGGTQQLWAAPLEHHRQTVLQPCRSSQLCTTGPRRHPKMMLPQRWSLQLLHPPEMPTIWKCWIVQMRSQTLVFPC